jgi:hypothetical protein
LLELLRKIDIFSYFTVAWGEQIFCGGYRRRCRPERSEGPPHGVTAARNRYCVVNDPSG